MSLCWALVSSLPSSGPRNVGLLLLLWWRLLLLLLVAIPWN